MPAGSTSLQWTATSMLCSVTLARPAVGLPVEVLPEGIDAIDDATELQGPVDVASPHLVERGELREVAEPVLRGLGHGHLVGDETPVALPGMDPESFRRLFRKEARRLAGGHGTEEEPGGEPDGTGA